MPEWSIGIDTGGTFTDLAAADAATGEVFVAKLPSTPANPADAIIAALQLFTREKSVPLSALRLLAHGTTVATNAVLEGKGAKAGLLVTEGFRAIYPGRGGTRPKGSDLVDPGYRKAPPLVPLHLTCEIAERIGFDGGVKRPLDADSVRRAARRLSAEGVRSVAICFLFCFMNPEHEEAAARILAEEMPGCRLSLSSRVLPVIREYPRMSTAVLDAYVGPIVERYFADVSRRAEAEGANPRQFFIMQSNGGLMRINVAAQYPNETLLSGPSAGVAFSAELARRLGAENVVTFDMGGTSTDISLIQGGRIALTSEGRIAGQDIGTPMIEIRTLGAGGGAIASVGSDGFLKVGPESAGAVPGPACYGQGGARPTVTDANVVLGYLDPTRFLGGKLVGSAAEAEAALAALGDELGLDRVAAALGVRRVVNAYMMGGLRLHITDKGGDPRRFTLVAFGGAGPLHAAELAEALHIPRIVIPPHPGISCAMGLLLSDVKHIYLQSYLVPLDAADPAELERRYAALAARALEDARVEGFAGDALVLTRQLDIRYAHQGYQLTLDLGATLRGAEDLAELRRRFDALHRATYGVAAPDEAAEIVSLRLQSLAPVPHMSLERPAARGPARPVSRRPAYFAAAGGFVETPVYDRAGLSSGNTIDGPLIVEQLDATSVIGPRQRVAIDADGNLVVELK